MKIGNVSNQNIIEKYNATVDKTKEEPKIDKKDIKSEEIIKEKSIDKTIGSNIDIKI